MGNFIFKNCFKRKEEIRYRSTLLDPLNDPINDPYSSHEIYLNSEILDIQTKLSKINNRLDLCENKIDHLEENTQTNIKLISKDIYHINSKLNIKPPVVI